jgi:hypothetical protein
VEEIPEGLVLLPAPRPLPRWRGPALAATSLLAAAAAGVIALSAADGPSLSGEQERVGSGQAELASTTSEKATRAAEPDAAEHASRPAPADEASVASPASAPIPAPAQPQPEPVAPAGDTLNATTDDEPAATGADEEATIASGGSSDGSPEAPPADAEPEPVPDPGQAIDGVGDVIEDITESLPVPQVIGSGE